MKIIFKMNAKTFSAPILDFFLCFSFITKIYLYIFFFGIPAWCAWLKKKRKKRAVKVLAFVFLKSKIAT